AGAALDKAAVAKLLAEAQAAKADDDLREAWTTARNELDMLIYSSRKLVKDLGGKLSKQTRARLDREIAAADSILSLSTKPADPKLLVAVKDTLQKVVHAASEEVYISGNKQP